MDRSRLGVPRTDFALPVSLIDLPLARLHIGKRTYNELERAGIATVGQLVNLDSDDAVPAAILGNVGKHLSVLLETLSAKGDVDWYAYWDKFAIPLIPPDPQTAVDPGIVLTTLPTLIRNILQAEETSNPGSSDRAWTILQRRFGMENTATMRLEELGNAYGLSRERIRQIERDVLQDLRSVFFDQIYAGRKFHLHPDTADALRLIHDLLITTTTSSSLNTVLEENITHAVTSSFGVEAHSIRASLTLLLTLVGLRRLEFEHSGLAPVWSSLEEADRRSLNEAVLQVDNLLTNESGIPMTVLDLTVGVNRSRSKQGKVTQDYLNQIIDVCSTVERREDGLVWGRFHLLRRMNQVERLLWEAANPLDVPTIARAINSRLFERDKPVQHPNLRNQMIEDQRFVPIGRSGKWALRSWSHINTDSILKLMEQCLMTVNSAAAVEEIYAFVRDRREDVNKNSISMYLQLDPRFARVTRTKWGLAVWQETQGALVWNTRQVADFVAQIFRRHRRNELPYATLRQELMDSAHITARQVQGLLRSNPVVKTRLGVSKNERVAVFQPDYESKLAQSATRERRTPSLGQRIGEATREILDLEPSKELAYSQLIPLLEKRLQCPKSSLYKYLAELDFVEIIPVPQSRTKLCRVKGTQASDVMPRVQEISDNVLREHIERALSHLTEENVDVGLFLLGKEFESTLKQYLIAAAALGTIVASQDPEKMKLVDMINCVKKNGIIEDAGALQYLREQRNDRAHGKTPNRSERQLMLRTAKHFAGMYIDYIRLFEDLRSTLR